MTSRAELIKQIAAIGDRIDAHHRNPPGTAVRAIYFWWWPPEDCGLQVLENLLADAQRFLAGPEPTFGDPCQLCAHPMTEPTEVVRGVCEPCYSALGPAQRPPKRKGKGA